MKKRALIIIVLLCIPMFVLSQDRQGIDFPNTQEERSENCQGCMKAFQLMPNEVSFSVKRDGSNLYFEVNDKDWFKLLFVNEGDGMAVDVVNKSMYNCDTRNLKEGEQIKGYLTKPVYAEKLNSEIKPSSDGKYYRVHVGKVPENFLKGHLEYNILFLNNKSLCSYFVTQNLKTYPWELMDMGVYLDSLTHNIRKITTIDEGVILREKSFKFTIPFKKNISKYNQQDIKPLYDSLRLTNFNIKKISIEAYSSIEGHLERNIELQNQRAESIVEALQAFQKPTIVTKIHASENWVEFLNDITGTKHEPLKFLSKAQVKGKVVGALSAELEPYLKNHRKAVITLELEKKGSYKNETIEELIPLFNVAIAGNDIDEAGLIQNAIFEKIKKGNKPLGLLKKMIVPRQKEFVQILNKNAAFRSMMDINESLMVYHELLKLEKLDPENGKVKYNIAAVTFTLWRYKAIEVDEAAFENQIKALKNYGITASLVSRMMVNFHIIKAGDFMQKRDYANKDISVNFIKNNYKNFPLSDFDHLSLAQFLSYYSKISYATELLEKKARTIDVGEDLLFYYLNLTLVDEDLTHDTNYRTTMLNAVNLNKNRFCKLFNAIEKGGVTFQLLEDPFLREVYCESCEK